MERDCEKQSHSSSDERKEVTIQVKLILHFRNNIECVQKEDFVHPGCPI